MTDDYRPLTFAQVVEILADRAGDYGSNVALVDELVSIITEETILVRPSTPPDAAVAYAVALVQQALDKAGRGGGSGILVEA